jgi:hypothetical protein
MLRFIKLLLIISVSLYANTVSNLKGELSVHQGALNYSIPLNLPVGTAGVKPNVSIAYNSNGSNGYMGIGWNISAGQSAITRCGHNLAHDGKVQGVKYNSSDNICLDGQRLVLISGTIWEDESEYRTKIDTYSKIIYSNDTFIVYTKAGDIKEYKKYNTIWLVKTIKDRYDNAITYNYTSNSAETYLSSITYADNTVVLNYEDKLDRFVGYSGGNKTQITKRIKSIDIKNGENVLRNYNLAYQSQNTSLDKSVLESIIECSGGECLEPLFFRFNDNNNFKYRSFQNWGQNGTYHYEYSPVWGDEKNTYSQFIDINGDGLPDRVHHYNYKLKQHGYWVQLNTGSGFGEFQNWGQNGTHHYEYSPVWGDEKNTYSQFIDINGDGLPDRVHHYNYKLKQHGYWVQLNTGSGFGEFQNWGQNGTYHYEYSPVWGDGKNTYSQFIDINGDGLPDRVHHYNYKLKQHRYWLQLNTGSNYPKLIQITDSFKNTTTINYKKLNDKEESIYNKYTDSTYPDRDLISPMQVVESIVSKNVNGKEIKTSYKYEGLKTNLHGLGSYGFAKITTTNHINRYYVANAQNNLYLFSLS